MPVGEFLVPCEDYPNCPCCPPKLSSDPPNKNYDCKKCGAKQMQVWDVPPEKLKAPDVTVKDFMRLLGHFQPSVSEMEIRLSQMDNAVWSRWSMIQDEEY